MQGFLQQNNSLIWTLHHETVRIEPWGRDSLRVRATVSAGIRDDLLSVLLPPAETDAQITIGAEEATIRNGALTASISPEGVIRFSNGPCRGIGASIQNSGLIQQGWYASWSRWASS